MKTKQQLKTMRETENKNEEAKLRMKTESKT
jgi:hypothetical protein